MVGVRGESGEGRKTDVVWAVQIHKERSLLEKLFGRNKMGVDDQLSAILESFVRSDSSMKEIDIDNSCR
jgi:hypothetical protein